jgi:hypothetical protein
MSYTGVCWGAGTNLPVTPDLQARDQIIMTFPAAGVVAASQAVLDIAVLDVVRGATATEVIATGRIGPEVNRAFFEIRAVNPNLVDTPIGRRDVRAQPGPVAACKLHTCMQTLTASPSMPHFLQLFYSTLYTWLISSRYTLSTNHMPAAMIVLVRALLLPVYAHSLKTSITYTV